jgi:hypothetical protein
LESIHVDDFGLISVGRAYHIIAHEAGPFVVRIHQIYRKSREIGLVVSVYAFLNLLFCDNSEDATYNECDQLILFYEDWAHCGERKDAEYIPLKYVERVVGSCRIQNSPTEPVGADITNLEMDASTERLYEVEWATSRLDWRSPSLQRSMIELRSMCNRKDYVALDPLDLDNLHTPCTVHEYNCGIGGSTVGFTERGLVVQVAVEPDATAAKSWKVVP